MRRWARLVHTNDRGDAVLRAKRRRALAAIDAGARTAFASSQAPRLAVPKGKRPTLTPVRASS
jgi:hypothetical protein